MNLLTSLRTLILALILSIGISYAYAAWSPPGAAQNPPPSGNIDAPVNVGAGSQTKQGDLSSNNFFSAPLGFFGSAGIGLVPVPPSLKLGVAGNTGADAYCDRDGNNCTVATALGGGVSSIIPGSGISVDQGTGNVTITNTGGSVTKSPAVYQCPSVSVPVNVCIFECTGGLRTTPGCIVGDTFRSSCVTRTYPCSLVGYIVQ